jgi:hypothetical protein
LIGQCGIGPWQVTEHNEAPDRSVKVRAFPIALVLLEGQMTPGLPFLRRFNWIVTADPTSEKDLGRLVDATAAIGSPGEVWRTPRPGRPHREHCAGRARCADRCHLYAGANAAFA